MTFSIAGALVSLTVLAPNLLLLVAPPRDGMRTADAGLPFTVLERVGQAACLVTPALTGSARCSRSAIFRTVGPPAGC